MAGTSSNKRGDKLIVPDSDSDENFAFIAGYTAGGAPYGVSWEELEKIETRTANHQHKTLIVQGSPVSLNDIVQEMEMISDTMTVYFRRSTGEFILVTDEDHLFADPPEPEQEAIRVTSEALENDCDYVALPSRYDIHEYSIMERFCRTLEDSKLSADLLRSISGKGAFRRFKEAVCRHSIEETWYRFKDAAYKEVARNWCEQRHITWCDGEKKTEAVK